MAGRSGVGWGKGLELGGKWLIDPFQPLLGLFEREGLTGELGTETNYSNARSNGQNLLMVAEAVVVAS